MIGVMTNEDRHNQMAQAIGLFPMLQKRGKFLPRRASIACYGPSLADTWRELRSPIISVSGAHDYLVERGIVPDFHVDCGPRPHKPEMLRKPQKATTYLMASVCHPMFWKALQGRSVRLWHLINGDDLETVAWVAENHPVGMKSMIGGGSSVGMRAMNVAAALGYRKFDIHGMDCSFTKNRHAGAHTGSKQVETLVKAGNRIFKTTKQMLQAAIEMEHFLQQQDAEVRFYGDGLMQETAKILRGRHETRNGWLDERSISRGIRRKNPGVFPYGASA
jgi:hypothetical protein